MIIQKSEKKYYAILSQSYLHFGNCLMGHGATVSEAKLDAYGYGKQPVAKIHWLQEYASRDEAIDELGAERFYS